MITREESTMNDAEKKEIAGYNVTFEVRDLTGVLKAVHQFSEGEVVWFRGHESCEHKLLPTLYRDTKVDFFQDHSYSSVHMAEDMRIQQYYARDYPFIKDSGNNTVEWLGMGQHFGLHTRFLDWSLSAIHSLVFALNKYVENSAFEGQDIPCLWVLKPQEMNMRIINHLSEENWADTYQDVYGRDIREIEKLKKLLEDMRNHKDEFKKVFMESNSENKWRHLDYIYNLSYFDRLLEMTKSNPTLALTGNVINPIFLILAMNYIDGTVTGGEYLDTVPLAIIHPLNSERIREQKGVFTVFPFPSQKRYEESGNNLEYLKMEWNPLLCGSLCKIVLLRPQTICRELKSLGVHRSWLFNEPEYIAKEIENGQ